MEKTAKEQAVVNVMAANLGQQIARLETEKAILMVDNQVLKDRITELENDKKDDDA